MTLNIERLKSLLSYSRDTGEFHWMVDRPPMRRGQVAGSLHKKLGYVSICIDKQSYLAHRLAWFYEFGHFPECGLDHANLNRADNRILNLRLASRADNAANTRKSRKNKSGFKGVVARNGRWRAQITKNKKTTYLGVFDCPEQANEAYAKAAIQAFGEFARAA